MMLPEHIHPIPKDRTIVAAIAAPMGFNPEVAFAFLSQSTTKAWALPTAVVVLSEIYEGHKAELRVFPLTDSPPAESDLRALLQHVFDMLELKVIRAFFPIEDSELTVPIAKRLGFQHDGVLRGNRLIDDDLLDDLVFSLTVDELEIPPRLIN